jgi:hypothetical protein
MALTKRQFLNKAEAFWEEWGDEVAHMLGLPLDAGVNFVIEPVLTSTDKNGNEVEVPAYTTGNTISLSWKYFQNNQQDLGAVIHEGVHALTKMDKEANPDGYKFVEDVAEARRLGEAVAAGEEERPGGRGGAGEEEPAARAFNAHLGSPAD